MPFNFNKDLTHVSSITLMTYWFGLGRGLSLLLTIHYCFIHRLDILTLWLFRSTYTLLTYNFKYFALTLFTTSSKTDYDPSCHLFQWPLLLFKILTTKASLCTLVTPAPTLYMYPSLDHRPLPCCQRPSPRPTNIYPICTIVLAVRGPAPGHYMPSSTTLLSEA